MSASPPRVLMIAPYCFPPVNAEAIVNCKLALAMLQAGWSLDVVADQASVVRFYPGHGRQWNPLPSVMHAIGREGLPGKLITVARLLVRPIPSPFNGMRWVAAAVEVAADLTRRNTYDVILSRSIPDYAHSAAAYVHERTGIPWIAHWNDPMPYYKMPLTYGEGPNARMRPHHAWLYRKIMRRAAWLTFACERMRRYMLQYLPRAAGAKSSVIPHIAAARFGRTRARRNDGFVLCHAGSLYPPRDARILLEGVKRFLARTGTEALRLQFIVDRPEPLRAAASSLGLDRFVAFEPLRPYEEMPDVLVAADVLVIVEANLSESVFFPSKLIDCAQVGRPILAIGPRHGTISDILQAHGGGIAADVRSPESVADALEMLWRAWMEGTLESSYGSRTLLSQFGEEPVLDLYRELFNRIGVASRRTAAQG